MTQLLKILGGVDDTCGKNTNNTIKIVGGFDKYLQPQTQTRVIGELSKTFVKQKNTEWATFKDVYFKNGKLDQQYYYKFMDVLNNIFPIPLHTDIDKEMVYMISTLYEAPSVQIINSINNYLNLLDPLKLTLRYLFMMWKIYLEKLIEIFIELREKYIETHKLQKKNKKNTFNELVERYVEIDNENKTDTSSPILFFNFPPKEINVEESIPKIEWKINGCDKELKKLIDTFFTKIKKANFAYIGFCMHAVITRFQILLSFPFDVLLDIISALDTKKKYNEINTCSKHIVDRITILRDQICIIKIYKNIKLKKVKVPHPKNFPKNHDKKIIFYEKYISAYLTIYNQILPLFINKEKLICELSVKVNEITNEIQKLVEEFDKIIQGNNV